MIEEIAEVRLESTASQRVPVKSSAKTNKIKPAAAQAVHEEVQQQKPLLRDTSVEQKSVLETAKESNLVQSEPNQA